MRTLSIFVDESGDFGSVEAHSPYYVLSLVFHDQYASIYDEVALLRRRLVERGLSANHVLHAGPLIRKERTYSHLNIAERRTIFRLLVTFARQTRVSHRTFIVDKRHIPHNRKLADCLAEALSIFVAENNSYFSKWHRIVVYYDNGQQEITRIVRSTFVRLSSVEMAKISLSDYNLAQVADLYCTLALLQAKSNNAELSTSEKRFFSTAKQDGARALKRGYLKQLNESQFR